MTPRALLLRRVSTVLLAFWLLLVVGVFVDRQVRRRPTVAPVDIGGPESRRDETPVRVQKGLVYNDVLGVEPNFRVAARETVEYASGWYELRDVNVSMFHHGAVAYALTAEKARFNPVLKEATATGEVQLSLGSGVAVRATEVKLDGTRRALVSSGAVTFAGPGWGGFAGQLSVDLVEDVVDLHEGVSISWRRGRADADPLVVLAPRLRYQRQRGQLSAPEGIDLLRGGLRLASPDGVFRLDEESGKVQNVRLSDPTRITGPIASGGAIDGTAGETTIQNLEGERIRLTAEPTGGTGWVTFRWSDGSGLIRELTTWRLVGEGSRDRWEWIEGQDLACASELAGDSGPRLVAATRLIAEFTEGRVRTGRAVGNVRIDLGDGRWAEGGELGYSLGSRGFTLLPAEGGRVRAGSAELDAECQRVEGDGEGGIVASGQVHGRMWRGDDGTEGVTRFAAQSARLADDRVILEDDARLWQGDRLIRADRLDYDRTNDIVTGKGSILTTGTTSSTDQAAETIRIRAGALRYDQRAGTAEYQGNVRVEDVRSLASCRQLLVTLGPRGGILYATLHGAVTILERQTGRVVRGAGARMIVARDVVEVWGQPVVLEEPGGNQVSGDLITWERGSGSLTVRGSKDRPSETIYVPGTGSPNADADGSGAPGRRP